MKPKMTLLKMGFIYGLVSMMQASPKIMKMEARLLLPPSAGGTSLVEGGWGRFSKEAECINGYEYQ
jgi:hypothetical protein